MKKLLYSVILFFSFISMTEAAPSTTGSTGMIDTPTADVLREGQVSFGFYDLHEGRSASLGFNAAKNLEISAARTDFDFSDKETYLNAKYAIQAESVFTPGIAVGVEDFADRTERTSYAVASKGFPLGFRVNVGIGNGRYDGMFYALEKNITPLGIKGVFPDTALIVEHDGHDMNYGVRMSVVPGLKLNAGWRDKETYVGVTYNLY
ncbi:YjbH domain-containing protein [Anaerosinus massiliensis]|uniref:YjbH domain-containing protein n=1 Tax=Massilibacillus massiliensis TaxID=1806837 RepID=UPI000DA6362E|nr:YjbH domain-containing protein [Massilibacillus massiliensis]